MLTALKAIWKGWKRLTHGLNHAISWVLMAVVYWTTMAPVALGFKLFRPDPIDRGLGDPAAPSYWLEPRSGRQDVRRAQRPW